MRSRPDASRVDVPGAGAATAVGRSRCRSRILYEDADLVVHRQAGRDGRAPGARATAAARVVNALLHHVEDLSGIGGELRPGHRAPAGSRHVGRDGGGEERRARTRSCRASSTIARSRRNTSRWSGAWCRPGERIDAPIGRDPNDRQKMSTRARRARSAVTRVTWARHLKGVSLLHVAIAHRTHAPDPRAPQRDRPPDRRRRRPTAACTAASPNDVRAGAAPRASVPARGAARVHASDRRPARGVRLAAARRPAVGARRHRASGRSRIGTRRHDRDQRRTTSRHERVFKGKVFAIDRDTVRMPNGREVTVDVVRHPRSRSCSSRCPSRAT